MGKSFLGSIAHRGRERTSLGSSLERSKFLLRRWEQNDERVKNRTLRKSVEWWRRSRLWIWLKRGEKRLDGTLHPKFQGAGLGRWSRQGWSRSLLEKGRPLCHFNYSWHSILYFFQVYSIVVGHLYNLGSDLPDKSSSPLTPYIIITILLNINDSHF